MNSKPIINPKILDYLDVMKAEHFWIIVPQKTEVYPILRGRGTVISLADYINKK
jgi:hypothetical protein